MRPSDIENKPDLILIVESQEFRIFQKLILNLNKGERVSFSAQFLQVEEIKIMKLIKISKEEGFINISNEIEILIIKEKKKLRKEKILI